MVSVSVSEFRAQMALNAAEIVRLHGRIGETVLLCGKDQVGRKAWEEACAEFHRRYDSLAFPGGYGNALARFREGDISVVEPALCFLEIRPYFFRSGYMFQVLHRRVKRAPLTPCQQLRMDDVLERRAAWRARKGRLGQPACD